MKTRYKKHWYIGGRYGKMFVILTKEVFMPKRKLARVVRLDTTTMVVMQRWVWRAYLTYSVIADVVLVCGIAYVIWA